MRQTLRNSTRLALTSVLSLALCASLGLARAQAQGDMSKSKTQNGKMKKDRMQARDTMSDRDRMSGMAGDDYDDDGMPASPGYPNAAPGSLDMNHWTDYSRKHMRSGSATEAMMDKRMGRSGDHGRMTQPMMEDEEDLMPAVPSYPRVSPGAIDMYHWTDYTRKHMKSGSAEDAKMDKMHMKDKEHMSTMMHDEDEEDLLPAAPSYPWAAPGSLDLNHWTDLTGKHMAPGSAAEKRQERMQKKDTMKRMK